jgi:hypothetical protein
MGRPSGARRKLLAEYDEIRAGVQRVLQLAQKSCTQADRARAAKRIGIGIGGIELDELPDVAVNMLTDVALFEPNQRGVRPFDRFLDDKGASLGPVDRVLADRVGEARFSIYRMIERHNVAGLLLSDLLADGMPIWLMDRSLEKNPPEGIAFGIRTFNAGPFHAGFGIAVPIDDDTVGFSVSAVRNGMATPFRYSIAATAYGEYLLDYALDQLRGAGAIEELVDLLRATSGPAAAPGDAAKLGHDSRTGKQKGT